MSHMTFEQAITYAASEASWTGYRYRVYKSRAVVGWWVVQRTGARVGRLPIPASCSLCGCVQAGHEPDCVDDCYCHGITGRAATPPAP